MSEYEKFFEKFGNVDIGEGYWYSLLVEELYQAIKSRLIAELTVDGWSQCGQIGGELKDKESGA